MPRTGSGRVKMPRLMNVAEKVRSGKVRVWASIISVSILMGGLLFAASRPVRKGEVARCSLFQAMKSGERSVADMWMPPRWEVRGGEGAVAWRRVVVRTRGPHALSRIRSGVGVVVVLLLFVVCRGRWGWTRVRRCWAREMLQPPVRAL